jgi:hypothetical protein
MHFLVNLPVPVSTDHLAAVKVRLHLQQGFCGSRPRQRGEISTNIVQFGDLNHGWRLIMDPENWYRAIMIDRLNESHQVCHLKPCSNHVNGSREEYHK